ncbi:hypothetical protein I79_000593 [Cricetulus griseus]|uniref:Uncharacterized protein n=1 Tax=Cricetulus griseus TaxID=10029 RepID=G3GSH9_CRIGR|nr:hypothetical protein I79_000593 [Cricetulus griseus]
MTALHIRCSRHSIAALEQEHIMKENDLKPLILYPARASRYSQTLEGQQFTYHAYIKGNLL